MTALVRLLELGARAVPARPGARGDPGPAVRAQCSATPARSPTSRAPSSSRRPISRRTRSTSSTGGPRTRKRACPRCGGTGFSGQTGIFELLVVTEPMREMIRRDPAIGPIKAEARKNGLIYIAGGRPPPGDPRPDVDRGAPAADQGRDPIAGTSGPARPTAIAGSMPHRGRSPSSRRVPDRTRRHGARPARGPALRALPRPARPRFSGRVGDPFAGSRPGRRTRGAAGRATRRPHRPPSWRPADWLDFSFLATCSWVRCCCSRRARTARLTASRSSTEPTLLGGELEEVLGVLEDEPRRLQGLAASLWFIRLLPSRLVSPLRRRRFRTPLAIVDVVLRRLPGGLREHPGDQDGIRIEPVDDPPDPILIPDPDLVAPRPDARHGPRVRHPERFPLLEPAQQVPGLHPRLCRERRSLDLAVEPHQRLWPWTLFTADRLMPIGLYVGTDIRFKLRRVRIHKGIGDPPTVPDSPCGA